MNCPACHYPNPPQAKFCMECGTKLQAKVQAERRQLTVLFCDLVGSTALSDKLDVEEYRQVILDYQEVAENVVVRYGGHIAQYLGDGLLVYFGYPKGLENAPKAAVNAGLEILEAVKEANQKWLEQGKQRIDIRIGIHTGLVVVDDFLAMGDTVNIAARLEGLAPVNGLLISSQTRKRVEGWFEMNSRGKERLKGIQEPMGIFHVLCDSGARSQFEAVKNKGLSPMLGREKEQSRLLQIWEETRNGRGKAVLLRGEAGIGKSRLLEYMKQVVAKEIDVLHLELYCNPFFQHTPFHPIIDLLERQILQFSKSESAETKRSKLTEVIRQANLDVSATIPLLADLLCVPLPSSSTRIDISSTEQKKRTIQTILDILWSQREKGYILLSIEDLHWADPSTLDWLDKFIEQLSARSVMMIGTTRPHFQPQWIEKGQIESLELNRLSSEDIERLSLYQTRGKALPEAVLTQIQSKTDGIPLFVEELSRMIVESDWMIEEDDHYSLSGVLGAIAIPSTIQDSLMARLDKLPTAKETIQMGAVIGCEFSFDLLNAASEKTEGELADELSQLVKAGLLYEKGTPPQVSYSFKHALIQETAYQSLLKSRRQQLHLRIAGLIETKFPQLFDSQPELLAHHLTKSGQSQKAITTWEAAARHANLCCTTQESIQHIEHALALLPDIPNPKKRKQQEYELLRYLSDIVPAVYGLDHPSVQELNHRLVELDRQVDP